MMMLEFSLKLEFIPRVGMLDSRLHNLCLDSQTAIYNTKIIYNELLSCVAELYSFL